MRRTLNDSFNKIANTEKASRKKRLARFILYYLFILQKINDKLGFTVVYKLMFRDGRKLTKYSC